MHLYRLWNLLGSMRPECIKYRALFCIAAFSVFLSAAGTGDRFLIDLSGEWSVTLDSLDSNKVHGIFLPGTLDMAGLGVPNRLSPALEKPQLLGLTRRHSYVGPATYSRDVMIPADWGGKRITLELERVLWSSRISVDGKEVDSVGESLVAPHRHDLTGLIVPGKTQRLTIEIDNSKRYDMSVDNLAHAYTDATQVIWNGMLGGLTLKATDADVSVGRLILTPDPAGMMLKVKADIRNHTDHRLKVDICSEVEGISATRNVLLNPGVNTLSYDLPLKGEVELWDEFNPNVYKLSLTVKGKGFEVKKVEPFGMREVRREGKRLTINGFPMFLRGTLECCIFPLTGVPPTDHAGWHKVFDAARNYGLNHLRFHSWCPPKEAFEVADSMGFYLQVELPVWSISLGKDPRVFGYLRAEAERISSEYGNHPSFCFWSLGNELQYDFDSLASLLDYVRQIDDNRHLYTTTSFTFEKGHGVGPEPGDDYLVTQWTSDGWVRGQGVFNDESPAFNRTFSQALRNVDVPLVTHEVGQYAVYPDISEIPKYTGTLSPLNFMAVRDDLAKKGMLDKAGSFTNASGHLAAILYKEEIERALKSEGVSGIQLLDLHDFPGQGTAVVGLLNAFWESKGILSAAEFREFCSPVVPLASFEKAVYANDEIFMANLSVANYSGRDILKKPLNWRLVDTSTGKTVALGSTRECDFPMGLSKYDMEISVPLDEIRKPSQLKFIVGLPENVGENSWNIWVYPDKDSIDFGNIRYTRSYEEALRFLNKGERVLFNPDWKTMQGVEGRFVPVFWSPVHFPKQAASMGILCDPEHPALASFPTASHSDWQWHSLNVNSTVLVADSLSGGASIVEVIDNFVNNRRLALLYEGAVGKGKLLISVTDLSSSSGSSLASRQLLRSVLGYMKSDKFNPSVLEGFDRIGHMFDVKSHTSSKAEDIY